MKNHPETPDIHYEAPEQTPSESDAQLLLIPEITKYAINGWMERVRSGQNWQYYCQDPQPGHLNLYENLYQMSEIKCVIRSRQTHAGPK